jgi:hypothetical protein
MAFTGELADVTDTVMANWRNPLFHTNKKATGGTGR